MRRSGFGNGLDVSGIRSRMVDPLEVIEVGDQNEGFEWSSVGFGTDWIEGVCWRCRRSETSTPLETCPDCRKDLIDE